LRCQHAYRLDTAQPGVPVVVVTMAEVVENEQALITLVHGKGFTPGQNWWSWSVGPTVAVCCRRTVAVCTWLATSPTWCGCVR
jgi:hypothetical protein